MLKELRINGVVLMPALASVFAPGLTVLTGETGAGKSIILDALGLVLGGRGDTALIGPAAPAALVLAAFDDAESPEIASYLAVHGLPAHPPGRAGLLVLRRMIGKDGRNRVLINEQSASVQVLRGLGRLLVSVEGQFRQLGLLDSAQHLVWLDRFAETHALSEQVGGAFRELLKASRALKTFERQVEAGDPERLAFAVEQLQAMEPVKGEEAKLTEQLGLLKRQQELAGLLQELEGVIEGSAGLQAQFAVLASTTERAQRCALELEEEAAQPEAIEGDAPLFAANQQLATIAQATERASVELEEAHRALTAIHLEYNAAKHAELDDRYHALRGAARQHGCGIDDLPDELARMREVLAGLNRITETRAERTAELKRAQQRYKTLAQELTTRRTAATEQLMQRVNKELPDLYMPQAMFHVELVAEKSPTVNGMESARFLARTNPNSALAPMDKIASGGELSRFLLAMNLALNEVVTTPTLIFDEIDSGVGGAPAQAIGKRLRQLAERRQVFVVTHSPQVAGCGHHHLKVMKKLVGEENQTALLSLAAKSDRISELARMLSGDEITTEAKAAAERLMAS